MATAKKAGETAEAPPSESFHCVTVKKAASGLGVKPSTIYSMIRRGELPAVRVGSGRTLRIPAKALVDYINQGGKQ